MLLMAIFALPLASLAAPAEVAQPNPSESLGRIQKQIDQSLSRRKVLSDELKALQREEEQISGRLIELAARIQTREGDDHRE